ncbi:MAG: hypothetical protein HC840_00630 [Leptolyngbyaceae cyanobacterium RM2_2_4]|nr:hypothetical protein [Leptolyngbyaceae cyanobacterium RM2_2_4]
MARHIYTPEEDKIILEKYGTMEASEISKILGVKPGSIRGRAKYLGFRKSGKLLEIGSKHGMLTVQEVVDFKNRDLTNAKYLCKCDCGNTIVVSRNKLMPSKKRSCGCLVNAKHEKWSKMWRKEDGASSYNSAYHRYRSGAKSRELDFNIEFDKFVELVSMNCHYCGSEPLPFNGYGISQRVNEKTRQRAWIKINGLDRIDSSLSYTENNVVTCCTRCNLAKMEYSKEDFIAHAIKIAEFQKNKD